VFPNWNVALRVLFPHTRALEDQVGGVLNLAKGPSLAARAAANIYSWPVGVPDGVEEIDTRAYRRFE
jgi:hypothetical protein